MRVRAPAGLCLLSLFLAGCNLDIDIVGEGRIYSTDQTIECSQDCRYSSYTGMREVFLEGEAAEGYRFLGMKVNGAKATTSSRALYGQTLIPPPQPNWGYRPVISSQVTGIFHPEADIVKAVSSSRDTCVLTPANTLRCWGPNSARYHALNNVSALFATHYVLCAEHDGKLQCWDDINGHPWTLPDSLGTTRDMAFEYENLCVLHETDSGNQVHCINKDGIADPPVPALSNPKDLRTAYGIFCADDDTGTQCWGGHYHGQSQVPSDLGPVVTFATGDHHTCAITDSGVVRCWGGNEYGQSDVPDDLIAPSHITAGFDHTCVYDSGEIRCWGANALRLPFQGETFNPDLFNSADTVLCYLDTANPLQPICYVKGINIPTPALPDVPMALAVSIGPNMPRIGAIVNDQLILWQPWQTSLAQTIELDQPYLLAAAGGSFCIAEQAATLVRCWGMPTNRTPKNYANPDALSLALYHGCGLKDNAVQCWGESNISWNRGQVSVPAGLPPIIEIDTGRFHSCALGANQHMYCWGEAPLPAVQ